MKQFYWSAVVALAASVAAAQQLPAGARDVDDHARENAASARVSAAESALEKQDYAGAEKLLKVLAVERPKDTRVLYDLGFAEERTGEIDGAAKAYADAIAANDDLAEPRVALGLLEARRGDADAAHKQLAVVAAMDDVPPELKARALRAMARLDAQEHPDAAVDELLKAVKLTGETPEDVSLSAELAARAGDAQGAEGAYRKALTADPGDVDAAVGLASALQKDKKPIEAEAVLDEAMQKHPDDVRLKARLAAVYAGEGKMDHAEPLLEELHAAAPHDANITSMLAQVYMGNDEVAKAEPLYAAQVAASPKDPVLLDAYGSVLVKEQKYAAAEAVLSRAVALRDAFQDDDAWGEAAGHLAFAASRNGHPEICLQALAARATVMPNSPSSLFLEATAHDTLHQWKDAERAYRAFLTEAGGKYPDEEFEARHRLVALEHQK